MDSTRLFVGNLPPDTTENTLTEKFSPYGRVLKVELKERKFLQPPSCFAFVTVGASKKDVQSCLYDLSEGYAWNGHPVTVDFAKESFLSRLEKERLDPRNKNIIAEEKPTNTNRISTGDSNVKKIAPIELNKRKVFNESSDSSSKEESSSESETDAKSRTIKKRQAENKKPSSSIPQIEKVSESSESDSSDSESDSNKKVSNKTSVGRNDQQKSTFNKIVQNEKFPQNNKVSRAESSDEQIDINLLVHSSNDVMKQFEKFSSVWADSSEDENVQSDSSEEIFEDFKKPTEKPTEKLEHKNVESSCSNNMSGFPAHKTNGDFVQFVKKPQVQSKQTGFQQVKVSSLPKFESKKSKPQASNSKPHKPQAKNYVDAENKRKHAMEERIKEISDKRKAIKQALANVDSQKGGTMNKKIVFSLDSDDEGSPATTLNQQRTINNRSQTRNELDRPNSSLSKTQNRSSWLNISSNGNLDEEKVTDGNVELNGRKEKKVLFDESESEEEKEEGDFRIKKQFEGDKGIKLLELQASYNNDTRFNLDDRFADDDDDDDNVSDKEREVDESEGVSEKEKQMQILENVLGYKVKQHQTNNGLHMVPRFDPLNPDSKSLLQAKVKPTRDDRKRKRKPRNEPVEVSEEKFYQMDEAYFTSKQDKPSVDEPFSLLKMLNRDEDVPESAPSQNFPNLNQSNKDDYRTERLVSSNPFGSIGARFEYDSSDSEEGDSPEKRPREERGAQASTTERTGQFGTGLAPPTTEKLFFLKDDDRFKEAQEFLRRKPSLFPPSDVDSFKLKRRDLALKLKTKLRRNMKNSSFASNLKRRKKTTKMMKTQKRR